MNPKTQKTIAGKHCFIYNAGSKDILLIQPIGEHDLETMDEEVGLIGKLTGGQPFTMVMFMTDWNRDLPPWEADAVMGDEAFEAGAADTLKENAALWKESGGEALQSAVTGLNELLERMPKVFH